MRFVLKAHWAHGRGIFSNYFVPQKIHADTENKPPILLGVTVTKNDLDIYCKQLKGY